MGSQSRDLNGRAVLHNGTLPILPKKGSDSFDFLAFLAYLAEKGI
jgi:hypothetical protein